MRKALDQAYLAYKKDEVPIGAVITKDNKIISKAYNMVERKRQGTKHAEMIAIERACKKLKKWRLQECTLYVTLQPCEMCMGAIIQSRIKKIVYAADSLYLNEQEKKFFEYVCKKNKIEVKKNIYEEESKKILKKFFSQKRK